MLLEQKDRNVIPRWRDFRTTLELGELENTREREPISPDDREAIARRVEEFEAHGDIWHAADLLSSAYVIGDTESADRARKFILANQEDAPKALVYFASGISNEQIPQDASTLKKDDRRRIIHKLRTRLGNEPRNAILWVELSRLYSLEGNSRRALRAMSTAADLAPDNRFVVRSAARLFLHEHDGPTALKVIRRAAGAKRDPWLLAAEIAVASASGKAALFAKIGTNRNEDNNISLFARTELSSALATLEMTNGKTRKARQLFRQSLEGPNENSVAQVEWANRQIGGLELDKSALSVPRSFEATANLNLIAGEWSHAVAHGTEWLRDQPFSKRPAVFTSYVSSLIEDYETSIGVLRQSLGANPDDPSLINNLAFALGSVDQLEEADSLLRRMDLAETSQLSSITLAATTGLLLFRWGLPEHGRNMYEIAATRATRQGNFKYRTLARLYLAREEVLASTPTAEMAVNRALVEASKLEIEDKEVALVAEQVRRLEKAAKLGQPPVRPQRPSRMGVPSVSKATVG